ncbi:MAG TPA: ABC transporter ATP-binding protein, partial [Candidatus Methanoperedenaceae archaeon]|nr:ABC transporter ATP-binding protein [Candidatus Methanoperedenaceae archaeon]
GGRLIADAPPGELKKRVRIGDVIRIRFEGDVDKQVCTLPGVLDCVLGDGEAKVTIHDTGTLDPVIRCFSKITDICMTQPDLEDVFLEFAKGEVASQ